MYNYFYLTIVVIAEFMMTSVTKIQTGTMKMEKRAQRVDSKSPQFCWINVMKEESLVTLINAMITKTHFVISNKSKGKIKLFFDFFLFFSLNNSKISTSLNNYYILKILNITITSKLSKTYINKYNCIKTAMLGSNKILCYVRSQ